jgi:hypothetical protein
MVMFTALSLHSARGQIEFGAWGSSSRQGIVEYMSRNSDNSEIILTCDVGGSTPGRATIGILIKTQAKEHFLERDVSFIVRTESFLFEEMFTAVSGGEVVLSRDFEPHSAGQAQWTKWIKAIKRGRILDISSEVLGVSVQFSLAGSAKIFEGAEECKEEGIFEEGNFE